MRPTPGINRVQVDLSQSPDWTSTLLAAASGAASAFNDGATTPSLVDRSTVDLAAETRRVQAASDSLYGRRGRESRYSCLAPVCSRPVTDLIPGRVADSPLYLAAWIADDPSDGDRDPGCGREWPAVDPGDGVRVWRCPTIRGSHRRAGWTARIRRPAVSRQHGCVEGVAVTSEAVRCPSCQALVHARHRRCPRCRAHIEVTPRGRCRVAVLEVRRAWDRSRVRWGGRRAVGHARRANHRCRQACGSAERAESRPIGAAETSR